MDIFLECLYDQDYGGLIISGTPTDAQLQEAWRNIYRQYHELMSEEGDSGNILVEKIKEIQALNAKIILIDSIVKCLSMLYDKQLIDVIKAFGIPCRIEILDDNEVVKKKLKNVVAHAKLMIIEMKQAQQELDMMQKDQTQTAGVEFYYDILSSISEYKGFNVPVNGITVIQFVRDYKRVKEYSIKVKRKQNGD